MLKKLDMGVVGESQHRSGWPYCLEQLQPLFNPQSPVLFDDFIERTFLYRKSKFNRVYQQPWVGVMHHPPDLPRWYMQYMTTDALFRNTCWQQSLCNLKLLIVLSDNVKQWWKTQHPDIPCVTIKHPTGLPLLEWSPAAFQAHPKPILMQVGWFLRNPLVIHHVEVGDRFHKIKLIASDMDNYVIPRCRKYYAEQHPNRKKHDDVQLIGWVPHDEYDVRMSEAVVLMEVISAAANNTVVECIIRNTPLCINRHPGPVCYLGNDYPLFYDDFDEINDLLTIENILAAHQYLKRMDKWWISGEMFREQLQAACMQFVPECRVPLMSPVQEH